MYINRQLESYLTIWAKSTNRKPLLLKGARQVGKSFLARNWGQRHFGSDRYLELNLEERKDYRDIFETDFNTERIISELQFITGQDLHKGNFLLFIDEIQTCPKALMTLRYLYERIPQLHVLAAGSLVDFVLEEISYPVGRIDTLSVLPLSFGEYLQATEKSHYHESLQKHPLNEALPEAAHNDLLLELKKYLRIGGMPEALSVYITSNEYQEVSKVHQRLSISYHSDFAKYAKKAEWTLLEKAFARAPFLVGDARVKYVRIDRDFRSSQIKKALHLLKTAGLIYPVYHSFAKTLPLMLGQKDDVFKLLFLDVGLMQHILGFDWSKLSPSTDLTDIANGKLAEQFVGQELIASRSSVERYKPYYWYRHKSGSDAEVDYLIEHKDNVVPVEVKSGHRGTLKSLALYMQEQNVDLGFVLSQRNSELRSNIQWIPLYMAGYLS